MTPSTELRKWYGHDPAKWTEFKRRYFAELEGHQEAVEDLLEYVRKGQVTLVYGSREQRLNNAYALREYLQARL